MARLAAGTWTLPIGRAVLGVRAATPVPEAELDVLLPSARILMRWSGQSRHADAWQRWLDAVGGPHREGLEVGVSGAKLDTEKAYVRFSRP